MAGGQKDQGSKQAGGRGGAEPGDTSRKVAGKGGMGPESNLGTSQGHANGVGEIYEKEGFGVNEAMSEGAIDDAVLDQPVKGAAPAASGGGSRSGGAGAGKGAQGRPESGQGTAKPGKR